MQPANDDMLSTPVPCSYEDGMFSSESRRHNRRGEAFYELRATCYHEASHAVVGYTFGERLYSVGVSTCLEQENDQMLVSYGGEVRHGPPGKRRTIDYPYRPLHFHIGVSTAAGPAGERRCLHRERLPMRLLGASEGDHQQIDGIAKMLEGRGRDR